MNPAQAQYAIRGGQDGKRRLEVLSCLLWPTTFQWLRSAGLRPGMRCLDLGCGSGNVTRGIARIAGRVVGIDMDSVKLEDAAQDLQNIEFRTADVTAWSESEAYDFIYSRFLLTHLRDPEAIVAAMRRALRPGGIVAIEDIDFTGSFCHPRCPAYDRYVELYREVVRRRGGDADIGPRLHGFLARAGFQNVDCRIIQPALTSQDGKDLSLLTLINMVDAILAEKLAMEPELRAMIEELDAFTRDPSTIVAAPRIFQVAGRRT